MDTHVEIPKICHNPWISDFVTRNKETKDLILLMDMTNGDQRCYLKRSSMLNRLADILNSGARLEGIVWYYQKNKYTMLDNVKNVMSNSWDPPAIHTEYFKNSFKNAGYNYNSIDILEKHTRKTNVKYPNLIIEKDLSFTIKSSINVEIFNNDIVCTEFNCFIDNNMTLLRDEKCVCINTDKNNIYKIVFQNSWLSGEFYNEIEMISEHF